MKPPVCSQTTCPEPATSRYEWPGQGVVFACERHAKVAEAVGENIGMKITVEPLRAEDMIEEPS